MKKKTQSLCYGQTISISPLEEQNLCIYSDGLIKTKACLREIYPNIIASGCLYYQSLFRIYPKFVTSKLATARELLQPQQDKNEDESKRIQKLQEIKQKVIVEYKSNIETAQKQKDIALSFNQPIQFLHIATNKFLACNYMEADQEKENFKLELNEYPSEKNTTFRLLPAFTHQNQQDAKIYEGDSVYIVCDDIYIGMRPQLHLASLSGKKNNQKLLENRALFTIPNQKLLERLQKVAKLTPEEEKEKEKKLKQSKLQKQGSFSKNSSNQKMRAEILHKPHSNQIASQREVNISLEFISPWILNIFASQNDTESLVFFGDISTNLIISKWIVWIHHIEANSIVCLQRNLDDELIISFQNLGTDMTEFQGNSNGMFQIENENMKLGGLLEWGQPVRLRHFTLAKYLAIDYDNKLNEQEQLLFYLADQPTTNTLFQFLPLPAISADACLYEIENCRIIKNIALLGTYRNKEITSNIIKWKYIQKSLNQQKEKDPKQLIIEDDYPVLVARLTEHIEDEDVLKLYKASYNEVLETNFLITCFPILRKSLDLFKKHHQEQSSKNVNHMTENEKEKIFKTFKKLGGVLEELDRFSNNELINTQLDVKNTKIAIQQRQKTLREQFFIEILIEIMRYITDEDELKKYHEHQMKMHHLNLNKLQSGQSAILAKQERENPRQNEEQLKGSFTGNSGNRRGSIQGASKVTIGQYIYCQYLSVSKHGNSAQNISEKHLIMLLQQKVQVLKMAYTLLTSICVDNTDNQYYLYKKFHLFLYQAKYFKEATECIITVIGGNEQIVSNLCDEIKLNEKLKENKNQQNQKLNNESDDSEDDDRDLNDVQIQFQSDLEGQVNKNLLLYYKRLTEESKSLSFIFIIFQAEKNIQYIQFYRTICKFNGKGISVNQEILFKFLKQNPDFKNSLFMNIIIYKNEDRNQPLLDYLFNFSERVLLLKKNYVISEEIYKYLVGQINLYSDLALQRNFLWKSYLERIFPTEFVFNQIFDTNMEIDYRSAFCSLALTVFVDHEPFNPSHVPTLCRLMIQDEINDKKKTNKFQNKYQSKYDKVSHAFKILINKAFQFINETCTLIDEDLIKKQRTKTKQVQPQKEEKVEKDLITNELVLNVIKLASIIVRFEMLSILSMRDRYAELVHNIVKMLEYDKNNLLYSYILYEIRMSNISKADDLKNNRLLSMKNAVTNKMAEIAKALTTSILGIAKKNQENLEDDFQEFDTAVIARNPIISSLITVTNNLSKLNNDKELSTNKNTNKYDLIIKQEVCSMLLYFQDLRQDFYISNYLRYFKEKGSKLKFFISQEKEFVFKLQTELKIDIITVLPPNMKTGVELIDTRAKERSDALQQPEGSDMLGGVGNFLKLTKKFTNLSGNPEDEQSDLDTLLAGQYSNITKFEILPSLLITFYVSTDMNLLDLLVKLMRRCFTQKEEMFLHLQNIEILFDPNDIDCYNFLQFSLQELKLITQCSEVWLVDFLAEPKGPDREIYKILKLLKDINQVLYSNTFIHIKGKTQKDETKPDTISSSRQKIFYYLYVHQPLVNFIRDTQNQFSKVIKDPYYSAETKALSQKVLQQMYRCLCEFCQGNELNQNVLYAYMNLFLDEIEFDVGQIELIINIFQDNKGLCSKVSEKFLIRFLDFIKVYGRQERFLRIFKCIQTYKKSPILESQLKVINLFIPKNIGLDESIDIHEYILYGQFIKNENSLSPMLKFHFDQLQKTKQSLDEPYKYHGGVIDVLLQTTFGDEGAKLNSQKIKSLFQLNYLLELMLLEDDLVDVDEHIFIGLRVYDYQTQHGITFLKPKLIQIMTQIYINSQIIDQFLFIKEQTNFTQFFEMEKLRLHKYSTLKVRKQGFIIYFFERALVLMTHYSEKIIIKDANQEFKERDDYQQLFQIFILIKNLSETVLSRMLTPIQYNNLVKFVYSVDEQGFKENAGKFSNCLEQHQGSERNSHDHDHDDSVIKKTKSIFLHQKQTVKSELISNQIQRDNDDFQDEEKEQLNYQSELLKKEADDKFKHAGRKLMNIQALPRIAKEDTQAWNSLENWKFFLNQCLECPLYQKEKEIEMRILGESLLSVEKFIPEQIIKELGLSIQFKDMLKKLIRYVELGIINRANKENLIFTFQLLEDILNNADDLVAMQIQYDQNQATRMVLNLLAGFQEYPFDDDLLLQLLQFACKLTKGGNLKIQSTIYTYFSTFENSELIFFKMSSIIREVIEENRKRQKHQQEKDHKKDKAQTQSLYLNQEAQQVEENDEDNLQQMIKQREMKYRIVIQLMKFLQLMCEGHNLQVQNYLRHQFNSRNNYNIVQAMVDLLNAFQTDLQRDGFEVIMNTLETLTELVQGPCKQNQQDIIDSSFLEVASSFLNMQKEKKQKKNKNKSTIATSNDFSGSGTEKSDEKSIDKRSNSIVSGGKKGNRAEKSNAASIERWMLERLKYKCMVLVTSLLELNTDQNAIKRIMRSLPIEVLKTNLITVFKKQRKLYGDNYTCEALKHHFADVNDKSNKEITPAYHELILEFGFLVYFLICYYSDLDMNEIDVETQEELKIIKEGQKASQEKDTFAQMQDTLIGQLAMITIDIVKGILTTIDNIRTIIQKKIKETIIKGGNEDNEDLEKKQQRKKLQEQKIFSESVQFFSKNSASIEVIRNGKLERIVFYKLSYLNYLPKESKIEFHESVDRDSVNSKISGLIEKADDIIDICKHEENLAIFFSHNKFLAIFANYVMLWKDLAFLLTLGINILIILSFYEGDEGDEDQKYYDRIHNPRFLKTVLSTEETKKMFVICGVVMIVCSMFVVFFFVMKKGPLYVKEAWNKSKNLINKDQNWFVRAFFTLFTIGYCLIRVLLNIDLIYYFAYGACAIIATRFHFFFFAFHLSEVVLRYPTLRNIIRSFWEPKTALLLTFVLVMLMNYFFSLYAYIQLNDIYNNHKCDSLLICFFATFDYAFKNNGGVGGWFDSHFPQDPENYNWSQFFFDQLYNIFINIISIQIFSGIIIDTFGSLREKQLVKNEDIEKFCFICGLDRELFDRRSDYGFTQHTKNEHYMWNYIFYLAYLKDKNGSDFNGIETYIAIKLKNQDNSWFPINKALGLESFRVDSGEFNAETLKQIEEGTMQMRKRIESIVETLQEVESLKRQ